MLKLSTDKVWFTTGEQTRIIEQVLQQTGLSISQIAAELKKSERTVRDWRREKFRMDYGSLILLCKLAKIPLPAVETRPAYSHTSTAGKRGAATVLRKYGRPVVDETFRKQRWQAWWHKTGQYNTPSQSQPKPIYQPATSTKLAEFIGIVIGDGGITKYQLMITLNSTDDRAYARYVKELCVELFKLTPSSYHRTRNNTVTITISRKALVTFLVTLGFKPGDKIRNQIDIPNWIKQKESFLKACLRGLFDTDGGIFLERHTIKEKDYAYARMAFVSASKPLIQSIYDSLTQLGFTPKIRSGKRVQLEKRAEIIRYFKMIKTSNPKHLKRFDTFVQMGMKC